MAPKIPSSPRKESEEEHSSSFRKRSSLCTFHEEDEDDYDDDDDDMWFSDNVNNYDESCVSLSIHDLQQIKEQHNNRHSDNEDNEAGHNSSSSRMRRRTSLEEDCIQTKMILAEQKTSMDSLQHQLNESQNENKLLTDVISYLRTKVDAANSQANSQAKSQTKPQANSQTKPQNNNNNNYEELYELRRQLLHQQHQNAKLTRQLTTATKDRNTYQTQVNHLSQRCDALSEEFHVSLDVVFQLRDRVERLTAERDGLRCRLNMDVVKEDSVTLPWIGGWFSSVHPNNKADQYLRKGKVVCGDASDTYVPTSKMDGIYGYTSNRKEQHHQQQQQHEEGPQGAVSPSSSTTELDSVTSNDDTVKASSSSSVSFSSLDTRGLFQFRRSNDNTATANTKDDSSASVAKAAAVASSANTSAAANSSARRRKPRAYSDAGLFGGLFKRGGAGAPPAPTKTEEKCPPNNSNSNNNNAIKNTSSKFDGSSARTLFPNASSSATAVRSFRSRSFGSETPHPEYDHENSNIWSRDSGKNMTWNSNRRFGDESNEDPIRRRSVFHTGLANNSLPPSSIMDENKSKTCIARPA